MFYDYNKKLIPRARELRKNSTKAENRLWYDFLSKYPIKFTRQKTIGNFIADFYCANAKLVIEVDGTHHYNDENIVIYDRQRSEVIKSNGIIILRFSNYEVLNAFDFVCSYIDKEVIKILNDN